MFLVRTAVPKAMRLATEYMDTVLLELALTVGSVTLNMLFAWVWRSFFSDLLSRSKGSGRRIPLWAKALSVVAQTRAITVSEVFFMAAGKFGK